MLASGACRTLVIALGYVYPAYKCFKALEKKKPEGIRFWCEYWLVLGIFTVLEQVGDQTVFWLPMYNEAKVLFVLWLWHSRTRGAEYVYNTVIAPLLQRYETDIDRYLDEGKARVGDAVYTAYQRTAAQIQNRFVSFVRNLPQATEGTQERQASGYVPRNAHEAAAMAYTARAQKAQ